MGQIKVGPDTTKKYRLEDQSLKEIQKIRERIGVKLFDDPKSKNEFVRQLGKLNQTGSTPKRTIQDSPRNVKARQIEPVIRGTWDKQPHPRKQIQIPPGGHVNPVARDNLNPLIRDPAVYPAGNTIRNPYSPASPRRKVESSRHSSTVSSLIAAVENLDRLALELELQGKAAKSKKMRKLGRKIRKQLLELTQARDN